MSAGRLLSGVYRAACRPVALLSLAHVLLASRARHAAQNAKRFRKASWKPAFKGRGGPRSNDSTPESKEDAALMATIYVTTDASGESIESAPERERALAA